jgi:hypothetical protein
VDKVLTTQTISKEEVGVRRDGEVKFWEPRMMLAYE